MDYNIRVYKVEKEDSNLRGFVSLTFEGKFCAKGIALKASKAGNLYLEVPRYQDYETKEYEDYFSIRDGNFRSELLENVKETYENIEPGEKMADLECAWGDEELYYDLNVSPLERNGDFKAEVSMKIQDVFVVQQMHVIKAWIGKIFVGMPQRENRSKGEKEDIANPVNAVFKRKLEDSIMDIYHSRIEVKKEEQMNRIAR